jgi:hypothetical protein
VSFYSRWISHSWLRVATSKVDPEAWIDDFLFRPILKGGAYCDFCYFSLFFAFSECELVAFWD